jgi:hypothetical protein
MEQAWLEVMALLQCDMNEEWSQELFQQGNGNQHLTWTIIWRSNLLKTKITRLNEKVVKTA